MIRAAEALHDAETDRWAAAWRTFWADVARLDPKADAAAARIWRTFPDDDVAAVAEGRPSAFHATILDAVDAVYARWCAELGVEFNTPEWERWWDEVGCELPHPDAPNTTADLSVWPHTVEPPPEDEADDIPFLRARLEEAEPESVEEWCAAFALTSDATVRTVRAYATP